MTPAEYRTKAAWHLEAAQHESDPLRKAEHLNFAYIYNRLADLADKNAATDVVYETPLHRQQSDQPVQQQQQQQQIQPRPEDQPDE